MKHQAWPGPPTGRGFLLCCREQQLLVRCRSAVVQTAVLGMLLQHSGYDCCPALCAGVYITFPVCAVVVCHLWVCSFKLQVGFFCKFRTHAPQQHRLYSTGRLL